MTFPKMKFTATVLAGLLASAAAAPLGAQDNIKINLDPDKPGTAATAAAPAEAAAPAKFTDEQKLEVWGFMLAQQIGLAELGFTPTEFNAIVRGMNVSLQGKVPPYPQEIIPQLQEMIQTRGAAAQAKQEKALAEVRDQNKKEADAYVATLKDKPGLVQTPSGLWYEILQPGKGPKPKADQTVKVNYTGRFVNGQVFDSSEQRGQPVEFSLAQVIPGWSEGLQLVGVGGKIRLHVPSSLGYGDKGGGPIPPGAFLIFEAELLEVKDTPKEAPAK